MNIFLLDLDPQKAAQAHADKHVVKMLLEACQLLYTAHWVQAYPSLLDCRAPIQLAKAHKELSIPETMETAPCSLSRPTEPGFRPCHVHHPCAIWVRQSLENYLFCAKLAIELAKEFTYRYPKKGSHECQAHAYWLFTHYPEWIRDAPRTPFVLAMDNQYKREDPVEAYRYYYSTAKKDKGLLVYKFRPPPDWLLVSVV